MIRDNEPRADARGPARAGSPETDDSLAPPSNVVRLRPRRPAAPAAPVRTPHDEPDPGPGAA